MLDTGPLGQLAHHTPRPEIRAWYDAHVQARTRLIIPEIADFEVRRNLLLHRLYASLAILDYYKSVLIYAPLTTPIMLRAADLWADARRQGKSTADPKELDGDVILAAQALNTGAIVATENVGHLSRYVRALHWRQITVS